MTWIKGLGRVSYGLDRATDLVKVIDGIQQKRCSRCKEYKPTSEYHVSKKASSGLHTYCKECVVEYSRERYLKDPNKSRESVLKRMYGITLEDYNRMYENQKGNCAICKIHYEVLSVDHNHKTSKVRKLLCDLCNKGLGAFADSLERLEQAVEYLKKNGD
jgi:Autographiviridae endonuclease VII